MSKKYSPKYQKLTERIRRARLDVGLTQVEAGKKLKQPQAYISKIERGERGIDVVELAEFAKIYEKPIDWFIKSK
jgi:transcriptional regulator with XRE-family HTH domain